MLDAIVEAFRNALGIDVAPRELTYLQVSARGLAVFLVGLLMLRVGEHRFLGKSSVFDVVLGFLIGSTFSRAINGSSPLGPTLVAVAVLLGLHWLLAITSFRSRRLGKAVKGRAECLVRDGEIQWEAMRKISLSEEDLAEALRLKGALEDPAEARLVYVERTGEFSVIPFRKEPRLIHAAAEAGVQTIRIEIS